HCGGSEGLVRKASTLAHHPRPNFVHLPKRTQPREPGWPSPAPPDVVGRGDAPMTPRRNRRTSKLNAQEPGILFCAGTGIDHAAVGPRQSLRLLGLKPFSPSRL